MIKKQQNPLPREVLKDVQSPIKKIPARQSGKQIAVAVTSGLTRPAQRYRDCAQTRINRQELLNVI